MKTIKQVHVEEDSDEDQRLPTAEDDYESDPDWHPPGAPEVHTIASCCGLTLIAMTTFGSEASGSITTDENRITSYAACAPLPYAFSCHLL